MKLTTYMVAILGLGLVSSVHGGISVKNKVVNGCRIVVIKTGGIICPSSTTTCYYPTNQPGVLLQMNAASNPGLLGSVAGAAGTATSGGLIHPAKVQVNQSSSPSAAAMGVGGETTVTPGNPGGNNGNGGNPHFN